MNKKKIMILTVAIFIFCFTIGFIQIYQKKHILSSFYPDTATLVYDMQIEDIGKELQIKKEWIISYHVLVSLFLTSSERIYLFECEEDYIDDVKKACLKKKNELLKQCNNSEEKKIILEAEEYYEESYCILIISENAKSIMQEVRKELSL